jgi:hypothetical protein
MMQTLRKGSHRYLFANRLNWKIIGRKKWIPRFSFQRLNQNFIKRQFHQTSCSLIEQKNRSQRPNYHEPRFYDPELLKAEKNELYYDFLTPQQAETPRDKFYEIRDYLPPFGKTKPLVEIGGPSGPEPTRYGDWERFGRVSDF